MIKPRKILIFGRNLESLEHVSATLLSMLLFPGTQTLLFVYFIQPFGYAKV